MSLFLKIFLSFVPFLRFQGWQVLILQRLIDSLYTHAEKKCLWGLEKCSCIDHVLIIDNLQIKLCEKIINEVDRRTGEAKCKHYIDLFEFLDEKQRNHLIPYQKVLLCGGVLKNSKGTVSCPREAVFENTVKPCYNEDLGTMKITLL